MKKLSKVLSVMIVSAMLLSLAACGSSGDTSSSTTSSQTSTSSATTTSTIAEKDTETGLPMMADRNDPVTFNVFLRDPGQAPSKDNPVIKKITELTGVTINFEFLVGDLAQKVGVMIAGGDYPDAIFGGEPAKFIEAGALIPMEDKLLNYPNLKRHYSPQMEIMKAGFGDGHAYTIENYNLYESVPPIFQNGGAGFFIQKAVLEESGYRIPKTVDEYFKLIDDYKVKHPTLDGVKTIGFEILCDGWRDFCLRNPAMHLVGSGNEGDVIVDQNTFTSSLYQTTDTAKSYYKKLSEEYQKGTIEAETFTENYDQYIARLSSGAVLGIFDQYWNFSKADDALKAAGKFSSTYISVPIANPGVKDNYIDPPAVTISGTGGIIITKNCKNVDRLLAFYDYLLNRDVQDYLQWGVEGKDYVKVGTNGKKLTDERRAIIRDTAKRRDTTGDTLWQYTPKMQGLYEDGSPCGPGDSKDEYMAALSVYDQNFLKACNIEFPAQMLSEPVKRPAYYPVWSFPIEDGSPAKVANTRFIEICKKYDPQLVLAKPAEYDALWNKFLKEIEASNPQPYLDEVNRQIKAKMDVAKK